MAIPHHSIDGLLLQWPPSITHTIKAGQATDTIYARVRVKYVTADPGATDGLWMQIGYGPANTLPSAWKTWRDMAYSKDYPATDDTLKEWEEWMGALMPDAIGQYTYLVRVSPTGGRDWVYGGFRAGTAYGGSLDVVPSTDTTPPAAPANLKVKGTTPASITLAWDANADADLWGYEVYRQPAVVGGLWAKVAAIPAGTTQCADREVNTGWSYNYYLLAVDTSYNRSPRSNQVTGKAEARMVQITFNVTVPASTPSGDMVYLPGDQPDLGPWTPNKWAMTRVDATHWTTTLQLLDGTPLQYKYARGSWDVVEWWAEIHDTLNRSLSVNYGADGTQIVNDTVPNWRDPLVVSTTPATGATGVAKTAVLSAVFTRGIKPEDLDAARFSLKTGDVVVAGAAAFDAATNTATFTPSAALAPGTAYTWTIGPGIRGDADAPMQNAVTVTFTTAP
jgi:hypothetical protein